MSDIKLDGDAAVVGGIHSDSHNTQNNYNTSTTTHTTNNSTVNNQTVYEAQKTQTEIYQRMRLSFCRLCRNDWRMASWIIRSWQNSTS